MINSNIIRNILLYIGILLFLYITGTVANVIGIKTVVTYSSFIIVLLFIEKLLTVNLNYLISKYKSEFLLFLLGFITSFIQLINGNNSDIKQVLLLFILPGVFSILLDIQTIKTKNKIQTIVITFFVLNCLLAIIERIINIHFFPEIDELNSISVNNQVERYTGFRSSSFIGHPLLNALVMSIIMGYIIISKMEIWKKYSLLSIGLLSLLSFNARGSFIVWAFIILIYIYRLFYYKRISITKKIFVVIVVILSAVTIYILIINYGFGDRFVTDEIFDESAKTRIDVFDTFKHISLNDIITGNNEHYESILFKHSLGGYENSYILLIIKYGAVIILPFLLIWYNIIRKKILNYSMFNKFVIVSSFVIVGSLNNNFIQHMPFVYFMISSTVFVNVANKKNKLA